MRHWLLAWQALRDAREASLISVMLVCLSVVSVVGSERAFAALAGMVDSLARSGTGYSADIDISRCAACVRVRRASLLLAQQVSEVRRSRVRVTNSSGAVQRTVVIPVHCYSPPHLPTGVRWRTRAAAARWSDAIGEPSVVLGSELAASVKTGSVHTTAGTWAVSGVARARAMLSADASDNRAIMVPHRAPFISLCNAGHAEWRVSAPDTLALNRALGTVEGELRTALGLRPGVVAPWRVQRNDRFVTLVKKLETRFRGWVLLIPLVVALLCGAGVFSVQTLQSDERIAEFGVRRAVGATRASLLGQLCAEGVLIGSLGVGVAGVLLAAAGLLGDGVSGAVRSGVLAAAIALVLLVLGMLIPGMTAVRAASIARLEGRGA